MICVTWDNSTIKFAFFVPARQRVHRYTRKRQSSVRFCLQVESKGNCSSDNGLKGSLKHSVLFQLKDLHPLVAHVHCKNVFHVPTRVSDTGGSNDTSFIKIQMCDTLLRPSIDFMFLAAYGLWASSPLRRFFVMTADPTGLMRAHKQPHFLFSFLIAQVAYLNCLAQTHCLLLLPTEM